MFLKRLAIMQKCCEAQPKFWLILTIFLLHKDPINSFNQNKIGSGRYDVYTICKHFSENVIMPFRNYVIKMLLRTPFWVNLAKS